MPTALLKKIHTEHKIPMKELEELWEKAKSITEKKFDDEEHCAYIMGVFKNMVKNKYKVEIGESDG